jgi:hypothetical protein
MFNKGGQELSQFSRPVDWDSVHTLEIVWGGNAVRHDLVDKNNLAVLIGE